MVGIIKAIHRSNVKKGAFFGLICTILCISMFTVTLIPDKTFGFGQSSNNINSYIKTSWVEKKDTQSDELIRFHVIANSDREEDQLLKYAVRDEILKQVAPRLAKSASLEESREIIHGMEGQLLAIAATAVKDYGKEYPVTIEHNFYDFPTKSYGDLILPGGKYEAVRVKIGEGRGENWWCVLFPPLCFVNVEESTTLPVDGKPAVPLGKAEAKIYQNNSDNEKNGQDTSDIAERIARAEEPCVKEDRKGQTEKEKDNSTEGGFLDIEYRGKKVGFFFAKFF